MSDYDDASMSEDYDMNDAENDRADGSDSDGDVVARFERGGGYGMDYGRAGDDEESDEEDVWYTVGRERTIYVPLVKPKWAFLRHWFELIKGRLFVNDPHRGDTHEVRIGREEHDWWIDVQHETSHRSGRSDVLRDDQVLRYRSVREAVLLMTLLSRVDNESWVGSVIRHAQLVPTKWTDFQSCRHFPAKFYFYLEDELKPEDFQWAKLKDLIGYDDFSPQFLEDFATLNQVAIAELGKDKWMEKLAAPVQINLEVKPDRMRVNQQQQVLEMLVQVLQNLRSGEQRVVSDTSVMSPPTFHLDTLCLRLLHFSTHPLVLEQVVRVFETGVHVSSIQLPDHVVEDGVDPAVARIAWAKFVVTILGGRNDGFVADLDKLSLGQRYLEDHLLLPVMSALHTTSTLKSFSVSFGWRHDAESELRILTWLCFAMLSRASRNSVDTLEIHGTQLYEEIADDIATMATSDDPFLEIWNRMESTPTTTCTDHYQVLVAQGADIIPVGFEIPVPTVNAPSPWAGTIIRDDPNAAVVDLLLPGFGLCQVARAAISRLEEVPSVASRVKDVDTLVIGARSLGPGIEGDFSTFAPFVPRFLEVAGQSVTSLALHAHNLSNENIRDVFDLCPKLESLRLKGAVVNDLSVFIEFYERDGGCQLRSLDLGDMEVPDRGFRSFIVMLTDESNSITRTLQRLRLCGGWSGALTPDNEELVEAMLNCNDTLLFFHIYTRPNSRWDPDLAGCNGFPIVPVRPLSLESKVAFFSSLRQLAHRSSSPDPAVGRLPRDTIKEIFDFAHTTSWRRAYSDPDRLWGLLW